MTRRINNYDEAIDLHNATAGMMAPPEVIARLAHVHATLYLADQQRIANLIAVAAWHEFEDTDVIAEIREGLGL